MISSQAHPRNWWFFHHHAHPGVPPAPPSPGLALKSFFPPRNHRECKDKEPQGYLVADPLSTTANFETAQETDELGLTRESLLASYRPQSSVSAVRVWSSSQSPSSSLPTMGWGDLGTGSLALSATGASYPLCAPTWGLAGLSRNHRLQSRLWLRWGQLVAILH